MTSNPLTNIAVHCRTEEEFEQVNAIMPCPFCKGDFQRLERYYENDGGLCLRIDYECPASGSMKFCKEAGHTILTASEFLSTYGGKSGEDANLTNPSPTFFKSLGEDCFNKLKEINPSGGIKEAIRIAAEFGYKSALKNAPPVTSASPSSEKEVVEIDTLEMRKQFKSFMQGECPSDDVIFDWVEAYIKRKEQQKQK